MRKTSTTSPGGVILWSARHAPMKHALATLVAAGLALGLAPTPEGNREGPYERVLDAALQRAQQRLQAETVIWQDHSTWANAWVVRSQNFEVRTTHSRKLGVQLTGGLEVMLERFQDLLGTSYSPRRPMRVDVLPRLADYNTFGETFGAEHSSFYGSFHAAGQAEDQVATYYTPNHTLLSMWVTHSVLHKYVSEAFPGSRPTWVDEGLASYFAFHWDSAYGVSEIDRIRAGRGGAAYIPLDQLLSAPLGSYTSNPGTRLSELGMLFTYLLHHREDTLTRVEDGVVERAPFRDYLRAMFGGGRPERHELHGLFTVDLPMLESDFRSFEFPG